MKTTYAVPLTVALLLTASACSRRPDTKPRPAQATPETRVEIVTRPIPGYPADLRQLGRRSVARITVGDEVREVPLVDHRTPRGLRCPVEIDGVTFRRAGGRLIVAWRVTKDAADPYPRSPILTEIHVASIDGNQAVHCMLAAAEGVRRSGAYVMPEPPWGTYVCLPEMEADGRRVVIVAQTREVPGAPPIETHRFVSDDGGLAWVSGERRIVAVPLPPARPDLSPFPGGPEPFPEPGDPPWRDPRLPDEPWELKAEAVARGGGRMRRDTRQPAR